MLWIVGQNPAVPRSEGALAGEQESDARDGPALVRPNEDPPAEVQPLGHPVFDPTVERLQALRQFQAQFAGATQDVA